MAILGSDQITMVDITDGYQVTCFPQAIALTAGATNKLNSQQTATVNVMAYRGADPIDPVVGTPGCPTNVTATKGTISNHIVPVTITFAAALAAGGQVTIPVTVGEGSNAASYTLTVSFSIAFKGATGAAAMAYRLICDATHIVKAENGTMSPGSITLTAQSQSGTNTPASYSGRFKIETSANGSTWTAAYTSETNEASKTFSVPANIAFIRASLYLAGGTATLLDQQLIPVVSDGPTGPQGQPGADAITVVLSDESHTFAAGTSAAVAGSVTVNVLAFKGATQIASTIGTISGQVTGLTTSIANNGKTNASFTVTVTTSLTTASGQLTIPLTVDGKSVTKKFSWALAKTGGKGDKGDKGDTGEAAYNVVITSSEGLVFKNTAIATTLTAHVYKGGAELTSARITAAGAIKWYLDGATEAAGTGQTYAISAGDVTDNVSVLAQLEA